MNKFFVPLIVVLACLSRSPDAKSAPGWQDRAALALGDNGTSLPEMSFTEPNNGINRPCSEIENPAQRLSCYDRVVGRGELKTEQTSSIGALPSFDVNAKCAQTNIGTQTPPAIEQKCVIEEQIAYNILKKYWIDIPNGKNTQFCLKKSLSLSNSNYEFLRQCIESMVRPLHDTSVPRFRR